MDAGQNARPRLVKLAHSYKSIYTAQGAAASSNYPAAGCHILNDAAQVSLVALCEPLREVMQVHKTADSSTGSTGLIAWLSKPEVRIFTLSSTRPYAVSATRGKL